MSLWTSTIVCVLLLQSVQTPTQQASGESKPVPIDEVAVPAEESPRRLEFTKKDWDLTSAYSDVFKILSSQNTCSDFYGGPRTATTVLNGFVTRVQSQPLLREVSFQMAGHPRLIRDPATGAFYRLFERTMVNTNGSFYQRRTEPMRKFPADVGNFSPGSRAARALILLHELGHLIQGENGDWLIPDDGFNGEQSKANTLRVQQMCRRELDALQ
jgi:hypothetical protein